MKKFEKIYLDIEQKIQQGQYPKDTYLPSEHQLAEQYQVSRETIRKALRLLEDHAYIQKKQGSGSIILDYRRFSLPISGLTSYKELQDQQNISAKTTVLVNELVSCPQFLADQEDVSDHEKFIHLIRTREVQGEVLIVDEDYLRQQIIPEIPKDRAEISIYQYFEEDLNLEIAYASKEIMAKRADEFISQALGIQENDYVMAVRSNVYLEDTTFFQHTISYHKLEKFRFYDFARRKQIFNDKF
ncbi:trehalose operon repressor [Ignavigranum ruoffiae]|uniref:trehalose operon repressor n=1 Tax=Ignavigranum ruoffiae TaxID=89093 RepID=UPI0024ADD396|nr:trehalose operon repressor [Ignavigranum ruoffiae]